MAERRLARLAPWSGLAGGALAWALQYQLVVDLLHYGCPPAMHRIGVVSGIGAALLVVAAGLVSWRCARTNPDDSGEGHRFIAWLGVLAAGFALLAIALQTTATQILPPCAP